MSLHPREQLTDGVITLQRYRTEDAGDVLAAATESVAEVHPWLPWCHPGYQIEEAHSWTTFATAQWNDRHAFEFCMRTVDGRHVGGCGINSLHDAHPLANLGYWVRTGMAGKGYATRAARLLAQFALTDLAMQRVEIVVAVGNLPSQRVAEKAGARREGVLRNRLVLHSVPHDAVMYSIVPEDFGL